MLRERERGGGGEVLITPLVRCWQCHVDLQSMILGPSHGAFRDSERCLMHMLYIQHMVDA